MILKEELENYPTMKEGKYEEKFRGHLFKVASLTSAIYCQDDGTVAWSLPTELFEKIKTLCGKKEEEIVRLRKEGLI